MSDPVFVIDDDEFFRQFLTSLLRRQGHEVQSYSSAREAIRALRREKAAVVISDLYMPEMDGIEVMDTLRSEFPLIPVIALSGSIDDSIEACLKLMTVMGAYAVFRKPLDETAFLAAVDTARASKSGRPARIRDATT